jgi:hypothetical protein
MFMTTRLVSRIFKPTTARDLRDLTNIKEDGRKRSYAKWPPQTA